MERFNRATTAVASSALPPLQHLRHAIPRDQLPGFELEFWCDGRPYRAFVRARNTQAAREEALCELAYRCHGFDAERATLVVSKQVH